MAARTTEVAQCAVRDLPQLYGLAMRAFGGLPGWSRRQVVQMLIDDVVFVAREAGRPVGYIALGPASGAELVVDQLLVAAGHERCAIGDGLLAQAEGFGLAEHVRSLQVRVDESNWAARSFYRRRGFVPIAGDLFELELPPR